MREQGGVRFLGMPDKNSDGGNDMAKRGGFPGGMGMPGNMNNLMKQAQKMQKQMI